MAQIKKHPWLLLLFCLPFMSCKKSSQSVRGNGCISQVGYQFETNLRPGQPEELDKLFAANNLSTNGLSLYSYEPGLSFGAIPQSFARVNQYINGLPVIYGVRIYQFSNNIYDSAFPKPYSAPYPATAGRRNISDLQEIFLDHIHECTLVAFIYDPNAKGPSAEDYKDSCLKASKVYIDKAGVPGSGTEAGNVLVLAWRITPVDADAPLVYVQDDNAKAWGVAWGYH